MLIIGSRIGNKRDPKEYACKGKGQCDARERVQTIGSREGSVQHRAPETVGGRKDAAGEVHRKERMEKEGRGAGMQWIKPSCTKARNVACTGLFSGSFMEVADSWRPVIAGKKKGD